RSWFAGHRGRRHRPGWRVRRPVRHGRAAARCLPDARSGVRHQQAPGRPGPAVRRLRGARTPHRRTDAGRAAVRPRRRPRRRGLDRAIAESGALVLGICGGYQMMARVLTDEVESGRGRVEGLGWLDVEVEFEPEKITRQRRGNAMGQRVTGYEIHHGRVSGGVGWVHLDDVYGAAEEGAIEPEEARFLGTTLHGLFEEDGFRTIFLTEIGRRAGKTFVPAGVSF